MIANVSEELFELRYSPSGWSAVKHNSAMSITEMVFGQARNDGIQRLYCAAYFDRLYEFSFENSAWTKTSIVNTGASTALNAVAVGPARGDGKQRVYVLQFIGGLYEFTYQN